MFSQSLILTVHNKDFLLEHVLESIKKNTIGNYELIVVLDGCSDKSESICFEFKQQAQQKECVDSSQGSHGGIHSNSHGVGGFSSRVPAFSSPLCHESNDEEDSETSYSEDNQKPLKPTKNKGISDPKLAEPLYEEDVIDGFAIISFSTYEDLEVCA